MITTEKLSFVTRGQAIKKTGFAYLGGVSHSSKIVKNEKKGVHTYILYLAPSTQSGYNVCPKATKDCIAACLAESGHNRMTLTFGSTRIKDSRIGKTQLFFENRPFFMNWLVAEIAAKKAKAEREGMEFSVRINGTSDLSLETFTLNGKNILQIFPDVQFYDYTKVFNRIKMLEKYPNYDLTFSYSGSNWLDCEAALSKGMRVAVVFEEVPAFFRGVPVVSGDESDLRYWDAPNVVVGLKFKKVVNKIDFAKQKFVIPALHPDCIY